MQNFNGSATVPLQIVPTLSSMDGSPSGDGTFNLFGSGFQAGAMTVTVGGVTLTDSQFTSQYQNQILGGNNGQDRIVAPLTLDGPVTVTTAGGSATLPGYPYAGTPGVTFTGITATAGGGVPAGSGPSANVGQTIVLNGQGFTNSTLVQFSAEDASGTHGTVTRTGTPSADGRSLSVVVPELARTGNVTVLGSGASFALQVVPLVRSVGGTVDRRQHDRTGDNRRDAGRADRDDRRADRDRAEPARYGGHQLLQRHRRRSPDSSC